jgi:hypothetical protein
MTPSTADRRPSRIDGNGCLSATAGAVNVARSRAYEGVTPYPSLMRQSVAAEMPPGRAQTHMTRWLWLVSETALMRARGSITGRADVCRVMPFRPCYPRVGPLPDPDFSAAHRRPHYHPALNQQPRFQLAWSRRRNRHPRPTRRTNQRRHPALAAARQWSAAARPLGPSFRVGRFVVLISAIAASAVLVLCGREQPG